MAARSTSSAMAVKRPGPRSRCARFSITCQHVGNFFALKIPKAVTSNIRFICRLSAILRSVFSRSEEHTSELQSHSELVCRLLLEKKNRHLDPRPAQTTALPE